MVLLEITFQRHCWLFKYLALALNCSNLVLDAFFGQHYFFPAKDDLETAKHIQVWSIKRLARRGIEIKRENDITQLFPWYGSDTGFGKLHCYISCEWAVAFSVAFDFGPYKKYCHQCLYIRTDGRFDKESSHCKRYSCWAFQNAIENAVDTLALS